MKLYPLPTPGFRQGTANAIFNSDNPQDQRKDNIRFDYRLNDKNQFTYRYSKSELGGGRRVPRHVPVRAHRLGSAELDPELQLDEHHHQQPDQRVQLRALARRGVHRRVHARRACTSAAAPGIDYPYIFPAARRSRTRSRRSTSTPSPDSTADRIRRSRAARSRPSRTRRRGCKGRHTFKGGVVDRVLGRGRLRPDQRQLDPRRHQQPERAVRVPQQRRPARTGVGMADMALGLFTNYAELGERAFTKWRVAGDRRLRAGLVEADREHDGRRRASAGSLWPPWYSTTNNIANFDPRFYDPAQAAVINPATGRITGGSRYNGIVLPGDGFEDEGNDLVVAQDPRGAGAVPRRAARLLEDPLQRVRAAPRHVLLAQPARRSPAPAPACSTTASR